MQEGVSPLGAERPRAEGLQGEALKKSNEGVDLGAKRSETLIYIYFIYILYIFYIYLAPPRALERQGFTRFMGVEMSVYGCRNVGLWV